MEIGRAHGEAATERTHVRGTHNGVGKGFSGTGRQKKDKQKVTKRQRDRSTPVS